MATNKIKVFDENGTDLYNTDDFNASTLIKDGYVVNTNIMNAPMNTVIRGTTLFVSAFLDIFTGVLNDKSIYPTKQFSYDTTLGDATDYIRTALANFIPLVAVTARKVEKSLTISLNGTSATFNGSNARSYAFYAPTTYGFDGDFLISKGANQAPIWRSTLPVANGGTGRTNFSPNSILTVNNGGGISELGYNKAGAFYSIGGSGILVDKLPISYGGTGAGSKTDARKNLGFVSGRFSVTTTVDAYVMNSTFTLNTNVGTNAIVFMRVKDGSNGNYGARYLITGYSANGTTLTYRLTKFVQPYTSSAQQDLYSATFENNETLEIEYIIIY
jgi:hypothetical protein